METTDHRKSFGPRQLVLLRHGQSLWNLENRFTGWTDVDLSPLGRDEARAAGILMASQNRHFDIAFTSVQTRAIRTLWMALDVMDSMWIPVFRSWRLNERHYGALQGLNKADTVAKFGAEQVAIWRRGFAVAPPPLATSDPRYPGHDRRYQDLRPEEIPLSESLSDTNVRFQPYWNSHIAPALREGKRVLVVAHGNSLRSLVKTIDELTDVEVVGLEIPTGAPLLYEFDANLKPLGHRYLGVPDSV